MGRPRSTRPWSKAFSNSLTRIRTETFCNGLKNPHDISTLPSPSSSVTTQKINPISPWLHVSWQSYTSGGTHPSQAQRERLGSCPSTAHLRGSPPRVPSSSRAPPSSWRQPPSAQDSRRKKEGPGSKWKSSDCCQPGEDNTRCAGAEFLLFPALPLSFPLPFLPF